MSTTRDFLPASPVMLTTPLPPVSLATPLPPAPSPPPMDATPLPSSFQSPPHPEVPGGLFRCPDCNTSFKVYTSFTRHLMQHHEGMVTLSFECAICSVVFSSKRSVSIHYAKAHSGAREAAHRAGGRAPESHVRQYCREPMPSKRSLGQHIRNQHAAEASKDRADREAERERPTQRPGSGLQRSMPSSWMDWRGLGRPTIGMLLNWWGLKPFARYPPTRPTS